MRSFTAISLFAAGATALSGQATTTRYFDGQKGACGCGDDSGAFGWQLGISPGVYTAAASQAIYDEAGSSWCGAGCGQCFQLTSTGNSPPGQGAGGAAGQSIVVMVTNLCPNNGNAQWCANPGGTNDYGFGYHFDLNANGEIFGDNVIVDFQSVDCPGDAANDWNSCQCASM